MNLLAFTVAVLALLTALAIFLVAHQPALTATRRGKAFAFVSFFVMPLAITGLAAAAHLEKAKTTEFCLSCHVMEPYGQSLGFADTDALPASHFQNRLVPRETACYTCHTTYTLFGDLKAKMNGMKHVWIYYTGQTPAKISLYQPYRNRECLSCHGESRSYLESAGHEGLLPELRVDTTSCLDCHSLVHDAQNLPAHAVWRAPAP
jgi:cytochrome c-type protein NapC